MRYKTKICFVLCSLALVVFVGCGEDFLTLQETLEIENIEASVSTIGAGETTSVKAIVTYSGDETVLRQEVPRVQTCRQDLC